MEANKGVDQFSEKLKLTKNNIKTNFTRARDQLHEREAKLLYQLNEIEKSYQLIIADYRSHLDVLFDAKQKITSIPIKSEDQQDEAKINIENLDNEIKLLTESIPYRNIDLSWNDEFEFQIMNLGVILVNQLPEGGESVFAFNVKLIVPDYTLKDKPLYSACKKYTPEKGPGELNQPKDIAIDPLTNKIYLADSNHHRVQVFNSKAEYQYTFSDNMNYPYGIAIRESTLYITQHSSHCINLYRSDGTFLQKICHQGSNEGQINSPRGITVSHKEGNIFVCDYGNNRVHVLDRKFVFLAIVGLGVLKQPRAIKLIGQEILVLDEGTHCLHVFDKSYNLVRSLISRGSGNQVNNSYFFDVDKECNVILTDGIKHCVVIFNKNGELLYKLGRFGSKPGEFYNPYGVALDNLGRIVVVCCKDTGCLQLF